MAVTAIANRKYQKQKPTKIPVGVKIHNRFDFYINDKPVAYGKSEYQAGMAENIVLDQMYTRLCARSSYFVNIHFGTGTGTLSAARTSLFTHLGTKTAVNDAQSKALPTSWWRQKIVLNPEEYVGSALSEVGIAFGSTSTNLVTHALIKDINGNPITLTKTALDVVTIYATVYVTFSTSNANLQFTGMPNNNILVNYLIGGASFSSGYFYTGVSNKPVDEHGNAVRMYYPLGTSSAVTFTSSPSTKKLYTNTIRFAIDASNGDIGEIGFGRSNTTPVMTLNLPASGIYSGLQLEGISIGVGDGEQTIFNLPSKHIDVSSLQVFVDSVETSITTSQLNISKLSNFLHAFPSIDGATHTMNQPAISNDGSKIVITCNYMANNHYYCFLYKKINDVVYFDRYFVPTSGNANACSDISSDGRVIAFGVSVSPFIEVYEEVDGVWIKRPNPSSLPESAPRCISLSSDGSVLALSLSSSPYVVSYHWDGDAWIRRNTPTGLGSYDSPSIDLSADGSAMIVGQLAYGGQCVKVYDWVSPNWVSRTNPASRFSQYMMGVKITPDGLTIAQYGYTTPAIIVQTWNGSSWTTKGSTFYNASAYASNDMGLSADGNTVCIGSSSSPYIYMYDFIDGVWVNRGITTINQGVAATGICMSQDALFVVHGAVTAAIFCLNLEPLNTQIAFSTPPGLVTAEAVGTGDGSTTIFNLDHTPIAGSLTMKLDGVETTDYTANGAQITFNTAPGSGVAITADYRYECTITADYTVNGIHKTAQRVIDLYAEITFGEVT